MKSHIYKLFQKNEEGSKALIGFCQAKRHLLMVFIGVFPVKAEPPEICLRERSPLQKVRAGSRSNLGCFFIAFIFEILDIFSVKILTNGNDLSW